MSASFNADAVVDKLKELVNKGNITKIVVKKDKKVIVSCPVTVGVAGVIIVPWAMILGVVVALGTKCTITCVDELGQEIDLDGKAIEVKDAVDKATEGTKMSDIKEIGKSALEKGKETLEKGKETLEKVMADEKVNNAINEAKKYAGQAADKAIKFAEEAAKKIEK